MTGTREIFPGYYGPSDDERRAILSQDGVFSFDARSLLNVFRFPQRAAGKYLEVLGGLGDRVWISYQAALEYHRNMEGVISKQSTAYDEVETTLKSRLNELKASLKGSHRLHTSIDLDAIGTLLKTAEEGALAELRRARAAQPPASYFLVARDRMADLLDHKIGLAFNPKDLQDIVQEGRVRYNLKIPPGYLDTSEKDEPDRFGDLIIWRELLRYARQTKRPIIFVTDDGKDDWWSSRKGERLGPRPELIAEMGRAAGVRLLLYETPRFITRALEVLGLPSDPEIVEQAQEVVRASQLASGGPERGAAFERGVVEHLHDLLAFTDIETEVVLPVGDNAHLRLDAVASSATCDYIIEIRLRSRLAVRDFLELRGRVSIYEELISRPIRGRGARGLLIGNLPFSEVPSVPVPDIAYVQFDPYSGAFVPSTTALGWLNLDLEK